MTYPKDGNGRYHIPSQEGATRIEADCDCGDGWNVPEHVWDWISDAHARAHNKGRDGLSAGSIGGGWNVRRIEPGKSGRPEMTTGCVCATPSCGGLAPGRAQNCLGCRVEAIRNPAARAVQRAVQRLLNGREWDNRARFQPLPTGSSCGHRRSQRQKGRHEVAAPGNPAKKEPTDKMNDVEIERQITDELTDQELARRDVADRSLIDAAAGMRYSRPSPGLYDLHACLDDGHLNAARQLIAETHADAQPEAEPD